jgi:3D (Asp-Asp-Asp) domain-containing protein
VTFRLFALALLLLFVPSGLHAEAATCRPMTTTAYDRYAFSPQTWDGTSVYNGEAFVAASWDIPIGAYVQIEGLGTFRVADRGMLGSGGWIDIAMDDTWSAKQYGHQIRVVCVLAPEEVS